MISENGFGDGDGHGGGALKFPKVEGKSSSWHGMGRVEEYRTTQPSFYTGANLIVAVSEISENSKCAD